MHMQTVALHYTPATHVIHRQLLRQTSKSPDDSSIHVCINIAGQKCSLCSLELLELQNMIQNVCSRCFLALFTVHGMIPSEREVYVQLVNICFFSIQ